MFLSRGERDLGIAFQTHPGRQASISSGSKEPRSALESRRVSLGACSTEDGLEETRVQTIRPGRKMLVQVGGGEGYERKEDEDGEDVEIGRS